MLIKNVTIVDPLLLSKGKQVQAYDVRVDGGDIASVLPSNAQRDSQDDPNEGMVFDGQGLWLMPGMIDLHTHLRDFGQSHKEDVSTGTQAAAQGGFTTVVAMANTVPPIDSKAMLERMQSKIREKALVEVLPLATVTKGMAGKELTEIATLAQAGAAGFSDDGLPVTNLALLRRALLEARAAGTFIVSHPEDKDLSGTGVMHEGMCCALKGLAGVPAASEAACIAREIEVVRATGAHLHFAHVSARASVKLIERAKADGLPVTADTTPHHLVLTASDIPGYNTNYKMNPPLRDEHDREALIEGLQTGVIDAIATDHAPHSRGEKAQGFNLAPCGIIGLETAFSLCFEKLAARTTPQEALKVLDYLHVNPGKILGIAQQPLQVGSRANFSLFDPMATYKLDTDQISSKSKNSPFLGRGLKGRFILTLVRGKLAYQYEPAQHRWLTAQFA